MPIVLRHNEQLELNLAEYRGAVTLGELNAVADFLHDNPAFLKRDTITVVQPDVDFASVDLAALDDLFARYAALFAPMDFQIMRRSAWICHSPAAQAHIDYWMGGRDTREAMSSTLRQFNSCAEAGAWLVLNAAEIAMLERGEGFEEIARFENAPEQSRAASR